MSFSRAPTLRPNKRHGAKRCSGSTSLPSSNLLYHRRRTCLFSLQHLLRSTLVLPRKHRHGRRKNIFPFRSLHPTTPDRTYSKKLPVGARRSCKSTSEPDADFLPILPAIRITTFRPSSKNGRRSLRTSNLFIRHAVVPGMTCCCSLRIFCLVYFSMSYQHDAPLSGNRHLFPHVPGEH